MSPATSSKSSTPRAACECRVRSPTRSTVDPPRLLPPTAAKKQHCWRPEDRPAALVPDTFSPSLRAIAVLATSRPERRDAKGTVIRSTTSRACQRSTPRKFSTANQPVTIHIRDGRATGFEPPALGIQRTQGDRQFSAKSIRAVDNPAGRGETAVCGHWQHWRSALGPAWRRSPPVPRMTCGWRPPAPRNPVYSRGPTVLGENHRGCGQTAACGQVALVDLASAVFVGGAR
jgi:hypothetical protein